MSDERLSGVLQMSTVPIRQPDRYPLSSTQQLWCGGDLGDDAGTFSPQFLAARAVRIFGKVDLNALQLALNDLVERHEIIRTIILRDAEPKCQQVCTAAPVPLDVRNVVQVAGQSRDMQAEAVAQEVIRNGRLDPRMLPLLRATLVRLDDSDSILALVTHHTAADGWSMQVLLRDLSALYAARLTGRPASLPQATQYRDWVAWEHARITGPTAESAMRYWREKLHGGEFFALPTDRPVPAAHTRPYSASYFTVNADVVATAAGLASAMRSSMFMVLMAAFSVLAYKINGTADSVFKTFSVGRNDVRVQDAVGSIMNILPLRTDISKCVTFRDIVASTRRTCVEAYSYEIPIQYIAQELIDPAQTRVEPMLCELFISMSQPQANDTQFQFGDRSYQIRKWLIDEPEAAGPPDGFAWTMDLLPSGELTGHVLYNTDEFDEPKAVGWASDYQQILAAAVCAPDREWRTL
jgi:condensation enzyme